MSQKSLHIDNHRLSLGKPKPPIITPLTKTEVIYELDKFRSNQKIDKYGWKPKVEKNKVEPPEPEITITEEVAILQNNILNLPHPDTDKHSEKEIKSLKLKYKLLYYGLWFLVLLLLLPNIAWVWLLLKYWDEEVTFAIKTMNLIIPIVVITEVCLSSLAVLLRILSTINCWSKKIQKELSLWADGTNGIFFSQLVVFIPMLAYTFGTIYDYRIRNRMDLQNKSMETPTWRITQERHNCCGKTGIEYWDDKFIPPSCCPQEIKAGENCTTAWHTNGCLPPERDIVRYYLSCVLGLLSVDLFIFVCGYMLYQVSQRWKEDLLHLEVIHDLPISPDDEGK